MQLRLGLVEVVRFAIELPRKHMIRFVVIAASQACTPAIPVAYNEVQAMFGEQRLGHQHFAVYFFVFLLPL